MSKKIRSAKAAVTETEGKREFRTREVMVIHDYTQSFDSSLREFLDNTHSGGPEN